MEYYFDTDDKLERKKYAEFLKSMLENCDKYRREDSDGAYVLAIDSPWGTGKTRFAKMLRNYLEDRTKEMGDDSLPGKNASFNAIYYNSWETDFSDDALLPLIYSITKSPEFKMERFNKKNKVVLGKFLDAAAAVAKISAYTILHNIAGEKVVELIEAGEEALTKKASNPLEKYEERLNLLDEFRKSLENVILLTKQKKLVVIVDELDRCRPTFAIQTLEIAKHLFAVDGLVFIFMLDIKQLSSSVKTIYGKDLDATGYLCRFFEYISRIPMLDKRKIIQEKILVIENSGVFSKVTSLNPRNRVAVEISEFILNIAVRDNLSIRELLTLLSHYEIVIVTLLKDYEAEIPFLLYFFFLFLKFRHHDVYNRIFSSNNSTVNWERYLRDNLGLLIDERVIMQRLIFINNEKKIKDIEFNVVESNIADYNPRRNGSIIESVEKSFQNNRECFTVKCLERIEGTRISRSYIYDTTYCFDQVLFYKDITDWENIKELTLPEYYHQQLEMFNFTLPADEPETKA